jgi:NAD(P)-dependent dehydrogenase (short-subunit alcohol dehydrogenase family)
MTMLRICSSLRKKSLEGWILVSSWVSLVLTIVAANAGVAETIDITKRLSVDVPPKPALKTLDVNQYGPVYAAYLAIHYFRTNSPATGGRFVVTSSAAGLYGNAELPLYCTSKFGVVGLVRALGKNKTLTKEGMTFNAICPGWVETGLAPPGMLEFVREKCPQIITPMATIMKAYNMFIDSDMTAQAVECSGNLAEPRPQPDVIPLQPQIPLDVDADGVYSRSTTAIGRWKKSQRGHLKQRGNLICQQSVNRHRSIKCQLCSLTPLPAKHSPKLQ